MSRRSLQISYDLQSFLHGPCKIASPRRYLAGIFSLLILFSFAGDFIRELTLLMFLILQKARKNFLLLCFLNYSGSIKHLSLEGFRPLFRSSLFYSNVIYLTFVSISLRERGTPSTFEGTQETAFLLLFLKLKGLALPSLSNHFSHPSRFSVSHVQ
jgi:hypothetical protein